MSVGRLTPLNFFLHLFRSGSWQLVTDDFAAEFERLRNSDAFVRGGPSPILWQTGSKYVLKVPCADGHAVYKTSFKINDTHRYWFRPSPSGIELFNMLRLRKLGIPTAEMLAIGETRRLLIVKNSFLISRFIDGRDGRDFCRNGIHGGDDDLKVRFCREHLKLLAKLHRHGILHRNFTPMNLLYRNDGDAWRSWWIDLASCRSALWINLKDVAAEIFKLFKNIALSDAQRRSLLADYLAAADRPQRDIDKLHRHVERLLAVKTETDKNSLE